MEGLDALHARLAGWSGLTVEFVPQAVGKGPKTHFIVREPGGLRLEFAFTPKAKVKERLRAPGPRGEIR